MYSLGLGTALQTRLQPYLTQPWEGNTQPHQSRVLKVPEYFAEYREKGDRLAAFLGASMAIKVCSLPAWSLALTNTHVVQLILQNPTDGTLTTKSDYSQRGPHAIIQLCATVL